jgi:thiol-disulfide isomerase/thioredoxin
MRLYILIGFVLLTIGCRPQEIHFREEALNDVLVSLQNEEITFAEILEIHRGKTILIDVWANWCKDCIVGMPVVKALQHNNQDVVFLFLSLDKSLASWKAGIEKYDLKGEHYFISSGWKGDFGKAIRLDWIPRYMIVNPAGEISLFKAVEAGDPKIQASLQPQ